MLLLFVVVVVVAVVVFVVVVVVDVVVVVVSTCMQNKQIKLGANTNKRLAASMVAEGPRSWAGSDLSEV